MYRQEFKEKIKFLKRKGREKKGYGVKVKERRWWERFIIIISFWLKMLILLSWTLIDCLFLEGYNHQSLINHKFLISLFRSCWSFIYIYIFLSPLYSIFNCFIFFFCFFWYWIFLFVFCKGKNKRDAPCTSLFQVTWLGCPPA